VNAVRPRIALELLQIFVGMSEGVLPRDPSVPIYSQQLAVGDYFLREYAAAVEAATRTTRRYPDYPNTYRWLAAALGQLGRIDEARQALGKIIELAPASFDLSVRVRAPWYGPQDYAHLLEGLRKAGCQD
jgi:adenylate cyclase